MWEIFKALGNSYIDRNPVLGLGRDIMAGNPQGFDDFMKKQYGPQMKAGRTILNPNSTNQQRADALLGMSDRGRPLVGETPGLEANPSDVLTPYALNMRGLPVEQGLPRGLLPWMQRVA